MAQSMTGPTIMESVLLGPLIVNSFADLIVDTEPEVPLLDIASAAPIFLPRMCLILKRQLNVFCFKRTNLGLSMFSRLLSDKTGRACGQSTSLGEVPCLVEGVDQSESFFFHTSIVGLCR